MHNTVKYLQLHETKYNVFLPCDVYATHMHSAVYMSPPAIHPSQADIALKQLNAS